MFNTCYRITGNEEDARDILQEAFVSAFRNLKGYKGEATFGSWLKKIVINRSINFIKKKRIELTELDPNMAEVLEDGEQQPNDLEVEYTIERVKMAISKLPKGYKLVFSLYLLEGYDHQEIAGILGISVSTSKSQYNRAKARIRQYLLVDG